MADPQDQPKRGAAGIQTAGDSAVALVLSRLRRG
jgi:hypothetical protein